MLGDHFAADEAAGDVGVNRRGSVERGLAPAKRPGSGLGVARGEEDDQPDRFEHSGENRLEARRAVAKLGRVLVGELGELGFELEVEAARPVDERDQRLRRERIERRRQRAGVGPERVAAFDVGEYALELLDLLAKLRIAGLRLRAHPLQPLLDVVAVGDDELELQLLAVALGIGVGIEVRRRPRSAASDLRSSPRTAGLSPGGSTTRIVAGVVFAELSIAATGTSRSSGIGAMPTCAFPYALAGDPGQGREERGLAGSRQADESNVERHAKEGTADLLPTAILAVKSARVGADSCRSACRA